MRDGFDIHEVDRKEAKAWRPSGALLALIITYGFALLCAGILLGAYAATIGRHP